MPGSKTTSIGDYFIVAYLMLAAFLLPLSAKSQRPRRYHKAGWFLIAGGIGALVNIAIEINNIRCGYSLEGRFSLGQTFHFALVIVYTALVLGVIPHLAVDVKGHNLAKVSAALCIVIYLITLALDLAAAEQMH